MYRPDFIGYGRSGGWPAGVAFDPRADVRVVAAALDRAGAPAHLVGHSYGAAVALEAALDRPERVASLCLIEPVAFHLLEPGSGEREQVERLSRAVRAAVARGQLRRAARIFMSFWIGPLAWLLLPGRAKARVAASIAKVALEFEGLERLPPRWAAIAALDVPVCLVLGSRTRAPARRVTERLAERLPRARLRPLRGAGHMSPFSHARAVGRLVLAHLERGAEGSLDDDHLHPRARVQHHDADVLRVAHQPHVDASRADEQAPDLQPVDEPRQEGVA